MAGYRAAIAHADGPAMLDRCLIADQTCHLPSELLMKTACVSRSADHGILRTLQPRSRGAAARPAVAALRNCVRGARGIFEPYLDVDVVLELWRSHVDQKTNHAYTLWPLLTFALWRSHLEGFDLHAQPDR